MLNELNCDKLVKVYEKLVQKHFNAKIKSYKNLGGGSYGLAVLLEFDKPPYRCVCKAYKIDTMNKTEALQLSKLRAAADVKIPEVFFTENGELNGFKYAVTCMEYIEGINLMTPKFLFFSKGKRKEIGLSCAQGLAKIHETTNDKFGYIENPVYDTWQDFYHEFALGVLAEAFEFYKSKKFKKKYYMIMKKAMDDFGYIFSDEVSQAVLTHGDLNVMNIMVDEKQMTLNAFIDPFNSMYADREYDLFQFTNITGNRFYLYDSYKKIYPLSEKADLKCAFYAMFNEMHCYYKTNWKSNYMFSVMYKRLKKQMKKHGLFDFTTES